MSLMEAAGSSDHHLPTASVTQSPALLSPCLPMLGFNYVSRKWSAVVNRNTGNWSKEILASYDELVVSVNPVVICQLQLLE